MEGAAAQAKLSPALSNSVRALVYAYDGSPQSLSDEKLLAATDFLAAHYPLSEEDDAAALLLREYTTAREAAREAEKPLASLREILARAADQWGSALYESQREQHRESRYPEEREMYFHKELSYGLRSGDPEAIIEVVQSAIASALRRGPLALGGPPNVEVPAELVTATKEAAQRTERQLAPYLERVAAARQTLSRYVYEIVALEGIVTEKS